MKLRQTYFEIDDNVIFVFCFPVKNYLFIILMHQNMLISQKNGKDNKKSPNKLQSSF